MASSEDKVTITIDTAINEKGLQKAKAGIEDLGKKSKTVSEQIKSGHMDAMAGIESLGNRFRYLSLVVGMTSGAMLMATKSFVESVKNYETAMLGVNVMAYTTGQSMDEATNIALKYAKTGLISITDSAKTLQNLLASGLNLDTADKLMQRMLDTSVFVREEQYTVGAALEKSSFGMRVLNERNIDAIGINQKLSETYAWYGASIGKAGGKLSELERHQAVVAFLMKESERYVGGADFMMNSFSGTLSRLSTNMEVLKIRMGMALMPVVGTLADKFVGLTDKFSKWIDTHKEAVSIINMGTIALTSFLAILATVGAMMPMLIAGFAISVAGLGALALATLKVTAIFLALIAVIGGIIVIALKASGNWDKWTNSIKRNIDAIASVFKLMPKAANEVDAKTAESYQKLVKQLKQENRDYEENLMELARKHSETIEKLEKDLEELNKDEKKYLADRKEDYDQTMEEMVDTHKDRVFEIERDLKEERSLGIRADQEKLRDLQERLDEENKEYEKDLEDKKSDYTKDVQEYKDKTAEKRNELVASLNEEYDLRKKHADEYTAWRNFAFLDEFEKMQRTHEERMTDLDEEITKLGLTDEQIVQITSSTDTLNTSLDTTNSNLNNIADSIIKIGSDASTTESNMFKLGQAIGSASDTLYSRAVGAWQTLGDKIGLAADAVERFINLTNEERGQKLDQALENTFGAYIDKYYQNWQDLKRGYSFQFGGVVPGSPSQAYPALVHGGETIIPKNSGSNAGLSPITVNVNSPVVRSDSDIIAIGDVVEKVLARRIRLQRLGA
jgi:hypothetical protein